MSFINVTDANYGSRGIKVNVGHITHMYEYKDISGVCYTELQLSSGKAVQAAETIETIVNKIRSCS